jgi:endonuclease/exonuclease/phosphatase family metal-dependent hydrolase
MPGADGSGRLGVATYNVHRCVGRDRRADPDRIAAVIRELESDVVALQEVAGRARDDGAPDQFAHLADATGLRALAGPTLRDERGDYGNALLTALPVLATRALDLSVPGREPRGALDVTLQTEEGALRVLATHLGLGRRERRQQIHRLLEQIERASELPLVLLGDMNEWLPAARSLRWLHARLGRAPGPPTFPARRPALALDRIWVSPGLRLRSLRVHASPLARVASDHLPVRAELVCRAPRFPS